MSKLKPVSILMPVCNEAKVIEKVLAEWDQSVLCKLPAGSELLFDDCSEDGTTEILREARRALPYIQIHRSARDGFFNSAMRLYRLAQNDLLFFTDSDGQYIAEDFWRIYCHIDEFDMVHGYKSRRCDPLYRKTGSLLFNLVTQAYFRSDAVDVNSAFRLVHRKALEAVLASTRHLRVMPNAEIYLRLERLGYRIHNVAVGHRARADGESRSLPFTKFIREGAYALRALRTLKKEITAHATAAGRVLERNPFCFDGWGRA
jgi:glycosyltransferase involved in cell wall biosynthesis